MNKTILLGRLVKDVELKELQSKAGEAFKIAELSLAINHSKEETSFVDIKAFGRQAELAEKMLAKGKRVLIEGGLKQETFMTKEGQNRSKMVINLHRFDIIDFKDSEEKSEELGF